MGSINDAVAFQTLAFVVVQWRVQRFSQFGRLRDSFQSFDYFVLLVPVYFFERLEELRRERCFIDWHGSSAPGVLVNPVAWL